LLTRATPTVAPAAALTTDLAEREKAMIENALRDPKGLVSGRGAPLQSWAFVSRRSNQRSETSESTLIFSRAVVTFHPSWILFPLGSGDFSGRLLNSQQMLNSWPDLAS
jgi:hypothetical protein